MGSRVTRLLVMLLEGAYRALGLRRRGRRVGPHDAGLLLW